LYGYHKIVQLDSNEWFNNKEGKLIKHLRTKNSYLQEMIFDSNGQRFNVLIDSKTGEAIETFTNDSKNRNSLKLLKAYYSQSK